MRPRVRPAAIVLGLALLGCQTPGRPTPAPAASPATDPAQQGREAFARRDWTVALASLSAAVQADPDNAELHYGLAVTATHLDARSEAVREFQWLLAHAPAGSEHHRVARAWLGEAGIRDSSHDAAAPQTTATGSSLGSGGLSGRVLWGERRQRAGLQLHLIGLPGTPSQAHRHSVRTDDDGRFEFTGIEAGTYKLSDRIAGDPGWRLRVGVEPGRDLSLDLTGDNRVPARDDFPPGAPAGG